MYELLCTYTSNQIFDKKNHQTFLNGSLIKAYTFNLVNDTLDKSIKARVIRFKNVLQK